MQWEKQHRWSLLHRTRKADISNKCTAVHGRSKHAHWQRYSYYHVSGFSQFVCEFPKEKKWENAFRTRWIIATVEHCATDSNDKTNCFSLYMQQIMWNAINSTTRCELRAIEMIHSSNSVYATVTSRTKSQFVMECPPQETPGANA